MKDNQMISPYSYPGMKEYYPPKGTVATGQQEAAAARIITKICNYYGIEEEKLLSNTREQPIAQIRHICMLIIREKTGMTVTALGKYLGKDHTSILHGIKKVKTLIKNFNEEELKADVQKFRLIC